MSGSSDDSMGLSLLVSENSQPASAKSQQVFDKTSDGYVSDPEDLDWVLKSRKVRRSITLEEWRRQLREVLDDTTLPGGAEEDRIRSLVEEIYQQQNPGNNSHIIQVGRTWQRGSYLEATIRFENGTKWLLLVPSKSSVLFWDIRSITEFQAEVDTLHMLGKDHTIPVPRVISSSAVIHNNLGRPYVLTEVAEGISLYDFWHKHPPSTAANRNMRNSILRQLAKILFSLGKFGGPIGGVPVFDGEGQLSGVVSSNLVEDQSRLYEDSEATDDMERFHSKSIINISTDSISEPLEVDKGQIVEDTIDSQVDTHATSNSPDKLEKDETYTEEMETLGGGDGTFTKDIESGEGNENTLTEEMEARDESESTGPIKSSINEQGSLYSAASVSTGPVSEYEYGCPTTQQKHWALSHPKDIFLIGLEQQENAIPRPSDEETAMLDLLRHLITWFPHESSTTDQPQFVLTHPYLDLDNIIVSPEGEIKALTRWKGVELESYMTGNESYPICLLREYDPIWRRKYSNRHASTEATDGYPIFDTVAEFQRCRAVYQKAMEEFRREAEPEKGQKQHEVRSKLSISSSFYQKLATLSPRNIIQNISQKTASPLLDEPLSLNTGNVTSRSPMAYALMLATNNPSEMENIVEDIWARLAAVSGGDLKRGLNSFLKLRKRGKVDDKYWRKVKKAFGKLLSQ